MKNSRHTALVWGLGHLAALSLATTILVPGAWAQSIQVKGSDTIGGALGPALAAAYQESRGTLVSWEALGSSTAFVGLMDGSADIGASSRSIKPAEIEQAERLGMKLRELVLGFDGIAVLVHPDNPIQALSLAQVADIFSGRINNWGAVGGPNTPIHRISRPSYSGTYGFFEEHVLKRSGAATGFAADTTYIEHSEDIARAVGADPSAVSYLGMGWNSPSVKAVAIRAEAVDAAVLPSFETVRSGEYPIFRELRLYVPSEVDATTLQFLNYCLGDGQRLVRENGFIPSNLPSQLQHLVAREDTKAGPTVERVYFRLGGAQLDREAERQLDRIASTLRRSRSPVEIIGHADASGPAAVNRRIALERAQVVVDALSGRGVQKTRLRISSSDSSEPVATNETAAGRAQNRRVDIRVLRTPD